MLLKQPAQFSLTLHKLGYLHYCLGTPHILVWLHSLSETSSHFSESRLNCLVQSRFNTSQIRWSTSSHGQFYWQRICFSSFLSLRSFFTARSQARTKTLPVSQMLHLPLLNDYFLYSLLAMLPLHATFQPSLQYSKFPPVLS
jgi:hypothetical protein